MLEKAAEAIVQPRIPLHPVMASGNDVEFISKVTLLNKAGKAAMGWKQAFLFAAGQIEVWHLGGIRRANQDKRIVLAAGGAAPRSENRKMMAVLSYPFDGKWPARYIDCRAQTTSKCEPLRMLKRQFDRSEAAH